MSQEAAMPLKAIPGITPMSLANMVENDGLAVSAKCERQGCGHTVSIPVNGLYGRGFQASDPVHAVGERLRCSRCGHLGAETRPDWTGRYDRIRKRRTAWEVQTAAAE